MEQHYLIDTNLIDNPGHDHRIVRELSEFDELIISIRQNGILQPLLVRPRGDRYEVIAGNRRLQAARQLGLNQVPALVRNASDLETTIFRFEENLTRADLNPVEQAKAVAESITALGLSPKEFAEKINHSEQWVIDRLAVADMPDFLQSALMLKQVPLGVALALDQIEDFTVKYNWVGYAAESGMTVPAAQNALNEWRKIDAHRRAMPEGEEVEPVPIVPPIVHGQCARCGTSRPLQELRFVRICNGDCPVGNLNS